MTQLKSMAADGDRNIPTNMRLLLLLEQIVTHGAPITPTEANDLMGLPKPTVHRLFQRLEEEQFLQRDYDGRSYTPGRRLRKMSMNVLSSARVAHLRQSVLSALCNEIGETCNLATPDGEGMLYLDRVQTKFPLRIHLPVGSHVPFHCSASGKVFLASLPERQLGKHIRQAALSLHTRRTKQAPELVLADLARVRQMGYSTDQQEFIDGMVAVAVPVLDDMGRFMCSLSAHGPVQRVTLEQLVSFVPQMKAAARELSNLLHG